MSSSPEPALQQHRAVVLQKSNQNAEKSLGAGSREGDCSGTFNPSTGIDKQLTIIFLNQHIDHQVSGKGRSQGKRVKESKKKGFTGATEQRKKCCG